MSYHNNKKEVWKDVPQYEGIYMVSNLGRVKSLDRVLTEKTGKTRKIKGRLLKQQKNENNYFKTELSKKGIRKTIKIHQIVAMAFLGYERDGSRGLIVDHIDNDRANNFLDNLQLITQRENVSKDRKNKYSNKTGVTYCKRSKKFLSRIRLDNKQYHLGSFNNENEAHKAYLEKLETYKDSKINNFKKF